jgi:crotonobetainyl-CoA:carnitine CoA-transferase CaiB-like acyl-CoA transferase
MPYDTGHWVRFLTLAGRGDLAEADWVLDGRKRSRNIERLYQILETTLAERTSEEWLRDLRNLDIPCAPVNDLDGLLEDPHLRETGFFQEVDHPTEGPLISVRSPFTARGVESGDDRPAPKKGAHSREILEELGYDTARIDALVGSGVVTAGPDPEIP